MVYLLRCSNFERQDAEVNKGDGMVGKSGDETVAATGTA
jgi:hypothetical protein